MLYGLLSSFQNFSFKPQKLLTVISENTSESLQKVLWSSRLSVVVDKFICEWNSIEGFQSFRSHYNGKRTHRLLRLHRESRL